MARRAKLKKPKLKHACIELPWIRHGIRVVIGDRALAQKTIRRWLSWPDLDFSDSASGSCNTAQGMWPVVWMPEVPTTPEHYATLAHELMHAVNKLAWHIGMKHELATEEFFCHHVGYAIRETMKQLEKKK